MDKLEVNTDDYTAVWYHGDGCIKIENILSIDIDVGEPIPLYGVGRPFPIYVDYLRRNDSKIVIKTADFDLLIKYPIEVINSPDPSIPVPSTINSINRVYKRQFELE